MTGTTPLALALAATLATVVLPFGGAAHRKTEQGNRLYLDGENDAALRKYTEALQIKPDWVDPRINVGAIYLMQDRLSEAATQYAAILQVDPENAEAHNNLAIALHGMGRREDAIRHFREAVRYNPGWEQARENLERALAEEEQAP